jgi:hypothetical protein
MVKVILNRKFFAECLQFTNFPPNFLFSGSGTKRSAPRPPVTPPAVPVFLEVQQTNLSLSSTSFHSCEEEEEEVVYGEFD